MLSAVAVALLAVLSLALWTRFLGPERLRSRTEATLSDLLDRPVTVERARLDWRGNLRADGISLAVDFENVGGSVAVATDVRVSIGWRRLIFGVTLIREVELLSPVIRVAVDVDRLRRREASPMRETLVQDLPRLVVRNGELTIETLEAGEKARVERIEGIDLTLEPRGLLRATGSGSGDAVGRLTAKATLSPPSLDLTLDRLTLDGRIPEPLIPRQLGREWLDIDPHGPVSLSLRIEPRTDGPARTTFAIGFDGVSARLPRLAYPLEGIHGTVEADLDGNVRFDIGAMSDQARFAALGSIGTAGAIRWPVDGDTHDERPGRVSSSDTSPEDVEDPQGKIPIDLRLAIHDLAFDSRLREALDRIHPAIWKAFLFEGRVRELVCAVSGTLDDPDVAIDGSLSDFGFTYHGFPTKNPNRPAGFAYPMRDLEGTIESTENGGHRVLLAGHRGPHEDNSEILLEGRFDGKITNPDLELRITSADVPLDRALYDALFVDMQKVWDRFEPTGLADISVRIRHEAERKVNGTQVDVDADLRDVAIVYDAFPLPIEQLEGRFVIRGPLAHLQDIRGRAGTATVALAGVVGSDRKDSSETISVRIDDLALDRNLRDALDGLREPVGELWDRLRLGGAVSLDYTQTTARGDNPVTHREATVELQNLRVTADDLPVKVRRITGAIELDGEHLEFVDVRGETTRLSIPISVSGDMTLAPDREPSFDIRIESDLVPISEDLRREIRRVEPQFDAAWETMQPTGELRLAANLVKDAAGGVVPKIRVDAIGCTLAPPFLTSPVSDVSGSITLADTQLTTNDLRGRYGDATLGVEQLTYDIGATRRFDITFGATNLVIRDEQFAKLPREIRLPLDAFAPIGRLDVERLSLSLDPNAPEPTWTAKGDLILRGLDLSPGVDIRDYRGRISIRDARLSGDDYFVQGIVTGDRVTVSGQPATEFLAEVTARPRSLDIRQLSAKLYRGTIDGQESQVLIETGNPLTYKGHIRFSGVRLRELIERQAPRMSQLRGTVKGVVDFAGVGGDILAFDGKGEFEIDDARLFEVPIVSSLLRVLPLRRPPVFTEAGSKFRLEDGRVRLHDLYLYSTPIQLDGEGRLDLDGLVDIVLFPQFAPDVPSILILGELWRAVQNRLIAFHIFGPLEDPVARMENIVTDIFTPEIEERVRPVLPQFPKRPSGTTGF